MIIYARARAVAAPPMSFFIRYMPLDGLMSRPPVSKQTPLPTSVTFGASSGPQRKIDEPWRLRRGTADRMDEREILLEQIVAERDRRFGAELRGERHGGRFERVGVHVIGRRVDEIAPERHGRGERLDPRQVDIAGRHELRLSVLFLLVAVEAISGERPAEQCERRVMRRVGEAVDARRQHARQLAWQKRVAKARRLAFEAEQNAGESALGIRQNQAAARRRLEFRSRGEMRPPAAGRAALILGQDCGVTNVIGTALAGGGPSKNGIQNSFWTGALLREAGPARSLPKRRLGRFKSLLGLTFYFWQAARQEG